MSDKKSVGEMTVSELQENWDKLQKDKIELEHRLEMIRNGQYILQSEMWERLSNKIGKQTKGVNSR